tara:strand:+ start:129 stop:1352 length:1224 start_codon:yes stop_codon:yes gene_type:complete
MSNDESIESIVSNFNSRELTSDKDPTRLNNFVDVTDALANSGLQLGFEHVPTGNIINFKAYITAFNETFSCDWASETVFGRVDPIAMFKQTTRNITLSFKVVAATASEGYENLYRVDVLRSFLYPTYASTGDKKDNAITLAQSPLVRVKVMNLLTDGAESSTYDQMFGKGGVMSAMHGALTFIKSMSVAHNLENSDVGVFHPGASGVTPVSEDDARLAEMGIEGPALDPQASSTTGVVPKMIEVSLDFTVLHEENMGWEKGKNAPGVYGLNMDKSLFPDPEPEPAPTQLDSIGDNSAASQASKDTRIAKFAQGLQGTLQGMQRVRQSNRDRRRYDRQYDRTIRRNEESSTRGAIILGLGEIYDVQQVNQQAEEERIFGFFREVYEEVENEREYESDPSLEDFDFGGG